MKILQMMDESWDSGITSSALFLARLLSSDGTDCRLLCPANSHASREAKRLNLPVRTWKGSLLFSYSSLKRWIQQENFDVLHAHTGSMHTLAWLIARQKRKPAIVRTRAEAKNIEKKLFYGHIVKRTDFFIFATERMRERFLITYSYPIERAKAVCPPLSEEWMKLASSASARSAEKRLKISIVGRLDPIKGHSDFLRAAELVNQEFSESRFEIIGAEKNIKSAELSALARKLGLEPKTHLAGFLETEALFRAMNETDIAVIASRGSEEVSRVCLEWMSLGKPIVSTSVGMLSELIQNGVSGLLVHPGRYEEIAYAVKRLSRDHDLRKTLGERARLEFHKKFTPQAALQAHLNLYREALKGK